ncbi:MAG: helix-turn-helix domain-containing protein [Solirubrobacteraceae bacterium]
METGGDREAPRIVRHGLNVLAQFGDSEVVLGELELARLTGASRSTVQQCLVSLSGMGYLTSAPGGYRLAERTSIEVRRGEDDTATSSA